MSLKTIVEHHSKTLQEASLQSLVQIQATSGRNCESHRVAHNCPSVVDG
jgi:hypothetical protein